MESQRRVPGVRLSQAVGDVSSARDTPLLSLRIPVVTTRVDLAASPGAPAPRPLPLGHTPSLSFFSCLISENRSLALSTSRGFAGNTARRRTATAGSGGSELGGRAALACQGRGPASWRGLVVPLGPFFVSPF